MSFYFYTITHNGADYIFDAPMYSIKKLAEKLAVNPKRIRRGSASQGKQITNDVLREIQHADSVDEQ